MVSAATAVGLPCAKAQSIESLRPVVTVAVVVVAQRVPVGLVVEVEVIDLSGRPHPGDHPPPIR
jgi:hypothetical protein